MDAVGDDRAIVDGTVGVDAVRDDEARVGKNVEVDIVGNVAI